MITVCQLDDMGYFVGHSFADESPLEPGVYHIPGGCVNVPVPTVPEGFRARYNAVKGSFDLEAITEPTKQEPLVDDPVAENITYQANKLLDSAAREFGYDGMADAATYQQSLVNRYALESNLLITWRDQVWDFIETRTKPEDDKWSLVVSQLPAAPATAKTK